MKDGGQCLGLRGHRTLLLFLLITIDVQIAMAQQGHRNCSDPAGQPQAFVQTGKGAACGFVWWRREVTSGLTVGPTRVCVPIGIL